MPFSKNQLEKILIGITAIKPIYLYNVLWFLYDFNELVFLQKDLEPRRFNSGNTRITKLSNSLEQPSKKEIISGKNYHNEGKAI